MRSKPPVPRRKSKQDPSHSSSSSIENEAKFQRIRTTVKVGKLGTKGSGSVELSQADEVRLSQPNDEQDLLRKNQTQKDEEKVKEVLLNGVIRVKKEKKNAHQKSSFNQPTENTTPTVLRGRASQDSHDWYDEIRQAGGYILDLEAQNVQDEDDDFANLY